MARQWVVHPAPGEAARVAADLKIHPAVATILLRRGLQSSPEIFNFLNPSLDSLESPFVFTDMQRAVDRVRLAVSRGEKILVYGDYDVDGITGSSILCPILQKMGAHAETHIPHRMNEGYGLNRESLEILIQKNKYGLVITVDNGITGVDQIRFLTERGVDVIIVDHHTPKEEVPKAFAILCANVGEQKGDPNLAACGLAFKFGWALLGDFKKVEEYLDLVTVGTVADLAPVTGDNRILLKYGLSVLAKTKRPGLRALMDVARISSGNVSYRDIAFGLGPRINAAGRMGSPLNAYKLLTTQDETEAKNLAKLLDDGNRDRQRVEAAAFQEAAERVEREFLGPEQKVLVLESPDWHEGVLGIVAARLVERYHKPAVVIALKEKSGKGSGRSVPSLSLFDSVLQCEDLLDNFGGHAQACGLAIQKENVPLFRKKLNETVSRMEASERTPELPIDAELPFGELDAKFLRDLEKIAPFGPGNKKPLFLSRGVQVRGGVKRRGKDTMRCWMTHAESRTTCEVVGFRMFERWSAAKQGGAYDIVHQPGLVDFKGIISIQLELEDWRPALPRP